MPQSLSNIIVHLVFSTKGRRALIDDAMRDELHAYTGGILQHQKCRLMAVNSVTDHLHVLFALGSTITLAKAIEEVKGGSSKWIKTKSPRYATFYWQNGYGAFSVSPTEVEGVKRYIAQQSEHHRQVSFQDELRELLCRQGLAYDERYLWD